MKKSFNTDTNDHSIAPEIFRAYDIRGIVEQNFGPEVVEKIGQAIGSEALAQGEQHIIVGRDGRLSGPELMTALIRGLCQTGIEVTDIGAVPTPLVYFATYHLEANSGVMLTGSHNPSNYNGLKIVIAGHTLSGEQIQKLYQRVVENDFYQDHGQHKQHDLNNDYLRAVMINSQLTRPLKIVVDCGNGIAGAIAPQLLKNIGCEVIELYSEVDGHFPNHHPDPSVLENLSALKDTVQLEKADLGIAFDGDGDRLGVISSQGQVIWPDRLLMLFAQDVIAAHPGAEIIYDVKCSYHVEKTIKACGGKPIICQTGHSFIKQKMRDSNALLAGEMSGHLFFKDRWYGFDDGIYAAVRLVQLIANDPKQRTADAIFATLPEDVSTPELKIEIAEQDKFSFMAQFIKQAQFDGATLNTIDGLRADFVDGWGLLRASNTSANLVLRFEAVSAERLADIQAQFKAQLLAINDQLALPF